MHDYKKNGMMRNASTVNLMLNYLKLRDLNKI